VGAQRPETSDTELEVLKALWDHGPGTVRELDAVLRGQGRRWAYTTVQTLLNRLQAKGYVASDKRELAHIYRPTVSKDKLLRQRLRDLAEELCEGVPTPLVLALVENHRFTAEEIAHFRRLIDELESKRKK
jgi:predicted transcriptional regulator